MKSRFATYTFVLLTIFIFPQIIAAQNGNHKQAPPPAEQNSAHKFDFRRANWGMSTEEVKKSESLSPSYQGDNVVGYKTIILNKNVLLVYIFSRDKLVRAKYVLAEDHSHKNDYINDYESFTSILTEKYGTPDKKEILWKKDLYKNDHSNWGMAIGLGHLVMFSKWKTDKTNIYSLLNGDNFKVNCNIEYQSIEPKDIEEKESKIKSMEDM